MAGAALAMSAGFAALLLAVPAGRSGALDPTVAGGLVLGITFPIVGWIVATKRPDNAIGWVFLLVGLSQAASILATEYATVGLLVLPGTLPAADVAAWLSTWVWAPGFASLLTAAVLLFPDGHPPSSRWRPVLWAGALAVGMIVIPTAVVAWPSRGPDLLGRGPSVGNTDAPVAVALAMARTGGLILMLFSGAASVTGLLVRFRRSTGVSRAQLKWFVAAGIVEITFLVGSTLIDSTPPLLNTLLAVLVAPLLPVAAGVAILRYRLYDIDRIVSRTVGYLLLTGVLGAVFAVLVVLSQGVLATYTESNAVAVAGSTLVVASLFQPLRRRLQLTVDRRFNRARVDAERVAREFADLVRDEVEASSVVDAMAAAVESTVQPAAAGVWIRQGAR